jgi:DMSO/TMAO reductase YedYZ molybdopterin-dependent catalytic subunit
LDGPETPPRRGRRWFLGTASRAIVAAAGASFARDLLAQGTQLGVPVGQSAEKIRGFPFERLDALVPPTDTFFLRSHLEIPRLDPRSFAVRVGGHVERPFTASITELERMSPVSRTVTFECSGSAVGGGMMGTAEWSGPLLWPLIDRARPRPGAAELVMEGADAGLDELVLVPVQYARSVPLDVLREIPGLLALRMNGKPLKPEHGFPVRTILPGLYGVQHVKWLARLTVVDRPYLGFYQTQRYVGMRRVEGGAVRVHAIERQRIKSQIARVEPDPSAGKGVYRVIGAAWSGGDGIRAVDVSTDGGRSWSPARIEASRDPYAWVLFRYSWVPAAGTHEILARATDGSGRTQPLTRDNTQLAGYINNWCHRKSITVGS